MHAFCRRIVFLLLALSTAPLSRRLFVLAEEAANDGDDYYGDDEIQQANADEAEDHNGAAYLNYVWQGENSIQYWTEFAIYPQRCIVYNDKDVIVFQMFANGYNHCTDSPIGTYIASVPQFVQGYLAQKEQDTEDQGYEWASPDVAQYAYCTPFEIQNKMYYMQLGCTDDSVEKLAVNIYEDNTCTKRSKVDGYDDSNIDVSEIQPKFKKCSACVNWFDRDDGEEVDDGFYENRMTHAPLCSTVWTYKEECGRKCQHLGLEKSGKSWQSSDLVLLGVLVAFGIVMVGLIVRKRQKLPSKDNLLEQAALSAAGLQQQHVIGIFALIVLVVTVFAILGLKNITLVMLLMINAILFVYLMKITIASSVPTGETLIGPDGEILRNDSDDDDEDDEEPNPNNGTYTLPTIA